MGGMTPDKPRSRATRRRRGVVPVPPPRSFPPPLFPPPSTSRGSVPIRLWPRAAWLIVKDAIRHPVSDSALLTDGEHVSVENESSYV